MPYCFKVKIDAARDTKFSHFIFILTKSHTSKRDAIYTSPQTRSCVCGRAKDSCLVRLQPPEEAGIFSLTIQQAAKCSNVSPNLENNFPNKLTAAYAAILAPWFFFCDAICSWLTKIQLPSRGNKNSKNILFTDFLRDGGGNV